MTARKVLLGRITGAHGLKGEVKIAAFTREPEDVAAYGALTNAEETKQFHILALRNVRGSTVVARLEGIDNRSEAELLRGTELFVSRDVLPSPEADEEYYHSDLIGLHAVSPDGEVIGEVIAVHNFGAGDLLEVRHAGERQGTLVPFDTAHVPQIDIAGGRLTVVRPIFEQEEGASGP